MSQSVQAAITKFQTLYLRSKRNLFLIVLEAGKYKIKMYDRVYIILKPLFLGHRWPPPHCVFTWPVLLCGCRDRGRERILCVLFLRILIRALILSGESHPHDLIYHDYYTSANTHLQIPSHWLLGHLQMNSEGTQLSL